MKVSIENENTIKNKNESKKFSFIHINVSLNNWNDLKKICKRGGITVRDGFKEAILYYLKCIVHDLKMICNSNDNGDDGNNLCDTTNIYDNINNIILTDIINAVNEENSIMKLLQFLVDLYSKEEYDKINDILQLQIRSIDKPIVRYNSSTKGMLYLPDDPIIDVRVYVDESAELFINTLELVTCHTITMEELMNMIIKRWKANCSNFLF